MKAADSSEEELRLIYLDWCSTRVAKRFLELSHDEVWLRSHSAASHPNDAEPGAAAPSTSPVERIPDYLDLVRKTALLLAEELNLPSYVEWKEEYQKSPENFRGEILRR